MTPTETLQLLIDRATAYFQEPNIWLYRKMEANAILRGLAALSAPAVAPQTAEPLHEAMRQLELALFGKVGNTWEASRLRRVEALVASWLHVALSAPGGEALRTCIWTNDDYGGDSQWETQCGHTFEFTTDGPTENSAKFCLYCGCALTVHLTSVDRSPDGR